ncbi:hypothetical protein F5B20DRAFT_282348 [Whalleya microplaca]|nr:hypothetical protein F5B20DRAFT_282348 [Whalleya microplaca]
MCRFLKHHAGCAVYGHTTGRRATDYTREFCAAALAAAPDGGVFGGCEGLVVDAEPDFHDAVCRRCDRLLARVRCAVAETLRRNLMIIPGGVPGECGRESVISGVLRAELAVAANDGCAGSPGSLPASEVWRVARALKVSGSSGERDAALSPEAREPDEAEAAWFAQAQDASEGRVGTMHGMTEIFADWFTAAYALAHMKAAMRLAVEDEDCLRVTLLRVLAREKEEIVMLLRRRLEYLGVWQVFVEASLGEV